MRTVERSNSSTRPRMSAIETLHSPTAKYVSFSIFVVAVFFLGGGSRGDIQSLVILRPLSILFIFYTFAMDAGNRIPRKSLPFWLLLMLAVIMIAQLLPLPFAAWSNLPGRAQIAQDDRILGIGEIWRTISLSPNRTLNSLFSLGVPIATFLLVGALGRIDPRRLLRPILAVAAISAIFGLLQILGPSGGRFYLYAITNPDNAVGLFSNRNHQAIFLASVLPLIAYVALRTDPKDRKRPLVLVGCVSAIVFAVPSILTTGSRAGIFLSIASLAISAVFWATVLMRSNRRRGAPAWNRKMQVMAIAGTIAVSGAALSYVVLRSTAFERLFPEQVSSELRVQILPYLASLLWKYFPVGSGFGTFELAYKSIEPFALLGPLYLNQAHDDLLQFIIEGGLPAALLLAAFMCWFVVRGWQHARGFFFKSNTASPLPEVGIFASTSLAIVLAGSLGDYPLRVPSMMLYAALLCALIESRAAGQKSAS